MFTPQPTTRALALATSSAAAVATGSNTTSAPCVEPASASDSAARCVPPPSLSYPMYRSIGSRLPRASRPRKPFPSDDRVDTRLRPSLPVVMSVEALAHAQRERDSGRTSLCAIVKSFTSRLSDIHGGAGSALAEALPRNVPRGLDAKVPSGGPALRSTLCAPSSPHLRRRPRPTSGEAPPRRPRVNACS